MSNWKVHLLVGLLVSIMVAAVSFLIVSNNWPLEFYAWLVLVSLLSPLLPDIDHNNSFLKKILLLTSSTALLALLLINQYLTIINNNWLLLLAVIIFLANWVPVLFKHRGFIHSITAAVIYSAIIWLVTGYWLVAVVALLGYWSHLLMDKIPLKIT